MTAGAWGGVAFAVLGALLLARAAVGFRRARRSRSWPVAEGTIVESRVERVPSARVTGSPDYVPTVRYRYQVGDETFTGSRLAFGYDARLLHEELAVERLARYPVGARVAVRYDPDRPAHATLETGLSRLDLFGWVWGALVFFDCAIFLPPLFDRAPAETQRRAFTGLLLGFVAVSIVVAGAAFALREKTDDDGRQGG